MISVPEWQIKSLKRGFREDALPVIVLKKVASCCAAKFRDAGMGREFAEAAWSHYKVDGTDLREIPSLAEQRAYVRSLDTKPAGNVPEEMIDVEDTW